MHDSLKARDLLDWSYTVDVGNYKLEAKSSNHALPTALDLALHRSFNSSLKAVSAAWVKLACREMTSECLIDAFSGDPVHLACNCGGCLSRFGTTFPAPDLHAPLTSLNTTSATKLLPQKPVYLHGSLAWLQYALCLLHILYAS
jgi:hypothetical protein